VRSIAPQTEVRQSLLCLSLIFVKGRHTPTDPAMWAAGYGHSSTRPSVSLLNADIASMVDALTRAMCAIYCDSWQLVQNESAYSTSRQEQPSPGCDDSA
jgi:hypothetical protein